MTLPVITVVIPTIPGREEHYERCRAGYTACAAGQYELDLITSMGEPTCGWGWQAGAEKMSPDSQYLHFTCDDIEPLPGWAAPAIEALDQHVMPAARVLNGHTGAPEYFPEWGKEHPDWTPSGMAGLPFMTRDLWENHVAPMFTGHYWCVVPETPVLTADLEWVPAGKLTAGDELVGVDEANPRRRDRKFRLSVVLANEPRMMDCVTVHLEDGRAVTCSPDHPWLAKWWRREGSSYGWTETRRLRPGSRIASPLRTWEADRTWEAGWLAGMLDGEGSIGDRLSFGQNPGAALDGVLAQLTLRGVQHSTYRNSQQSRVVGVHAGRNWQVMELLGTVRPGRLIAARHWEGRSIRGRELRVGVVAAVEPAGRREVAALGTSTGTFLADGLISHNTDNWCTWRAVQAGYVARVRLGFAFRHYWADHRRGAGMGYEERLLHDRDLFFQATVMEQAGNWSKPWPPREAVT